MNRFYRHLFELNDIDLNIPNYYYSAYLFQNVKIATNNKKIEKGHLTLHFEYQYFFHSVYTSYK